MRRADDGRASLVEFIDSIKFSRKSRTSPDAEFTPHFARFTQRAGASCQTSAEESKLIRSAN